VAQPVAPLVSIHVVGLSDPYRLPYESASFVCFSIVTSEAVMVTRYKGHRHLLPAGEIKCRSIHAKDRADIDYLTGLRIESGLVWVFIAHTVDVLQTDNKCPDTRLVRLHQGCVVTKHRPALCVFSGVRLLGASTTNH